MNILRGVARWFLSLAIAMMLTAWISFGVLQATILNRTIVEGWLRDSGAYQNIIDSFHLESTGQTFITSTELIAALKATFPPSYLQQQGETVLNATYDWVEGKKPAITFSIPIQNKRADYSANLANIITPRLAALPQCKTRVNPDVNNPTCIPQGLSAAELAKQLTQLDDGGNFLNKPLTADTFAVATQKMPTHWIPVTVASLNWLMVIFPVGMVLCAAGYVLLSDSKIKGLSVIGRRVFLNGLVLTIFGAILWQMGGSFKVSSIIGAADYAHIVDPLFQRVVVAMGSTLTAMSAIVMAVGGAGWGTAIALKRRQHVSTASLDQPRTLPKPPTPHQPLPPTTPQEPSAMTPPKE